MDIELRQRHVAISLAFAGCAAVAVVALGTTALVGWVSNLDILKSFLHPGKIAMNPATAACFILAGVALAESVWHAPRRAPGTGLAEPAVALPPPRSPLAR